MAGVVSVASDNCLLRVHDPLTKLNFLIDSGAAVSVIPVPSALKSSLPTGPPLGAANGSRIDSFGERNLTLSLGLRRSFPWSFLYADVSQPLLGADFLEHFDLLVDRRRKCLIDNSTKLTSSGVPVTYDIRGISLLLPTPTSPYQALLQEKFKELVLPYNEPVPVKHSVRHFIETTGPPAFARARRLDVERSAAAKAEFDRLLALKIIRPSSSSWSSPLHLVKKPDGTWRPTVDFRQVNSKTRPDRYNIPHLQSFSDHLDGCTVFSKVDLVRAYHQIPVAEEDIPKTATITPWGLYEWLRLPFGLCGAAQTFQRFIDNVLRGLPFVWVYLDDILIASDTPEHHLDNLNQLFSRLQEAGLRINPDKCVFGADSLTFLGHSVSAAGITPLLSRVEAIRQFPQPSTQKQLRQYLGMVNFYHRFIPQAAAKLAPLSALLKAPRRGSSTAITWSPESTAAFDNSKRALAEAALLVFPRSSIPTRLQVDASEVAVGSILEQLQNDHWVPLAFFSRKLSPTEARYSAFGRELLAIYMSVRHFRYFLEGRPFHILTDHKPLTFAMRSRHERHSPREARHLEYISQFSTDLRHISGATNFTADALSRVTLSSITPLPSVDLSALADAQSNYNFTPDSDSSLSFTKITFPGVEKSILCDISTGVARPLVPPLFRRIVFDALHSLSHPGVNASLKLVSSRYVWPSMNSDVRHWAKCCLACQTNKIQRHTKSPLVSFTPPDRRFDFVHVDLVGPLGPSEGYSYIFTMIDRFTRWPEAVPIREPTAEAIARVFLNTWVARFGVPSVVMTDQGRQFESYLWRDLMRLLGSDRVRSNAYHPIANGMVERFHRQLKASLASHPLRSQWTKAFQLVLLGINSALKEDLGCTAAELRVRLSS